MTLYVQKRTPLLTPRRILLIVLIVSILFFVVMFSLMNRKSIDLYAHSGHIDAIALSLDGRFLASGGDDDVMQVWDLEGSRLYAQYDTEDRRIYTFAWSPDSQSIAICLSNTTIEVWDIVQNTISATFEVTSCADKIAWLNSNEIITPNLERLEVNSGSVIDYGSLYPSATWDLLRGQFAIYHEEQIVITDFDDTGMSIHMGYETELIQWHPDGAYIAAVSPQNSVDIWSLDTGDVQQTFPQELEIQSVYWNHAGTQLAVAVGGTNLNDSNFQIHIYDFPAATNVTINIPSDMSLQTDSLMWSTDDNTLAVALEPDPNQLEWFGEIWLINTTSGEVFETLNYIAPITAIAWNPNTNGIIAGSMDGSIKLWRID